MLPNGPGLLSTPTEGQEGWGSLHSSDRPAVHMRQAAMTVAARTPALARQDPAQPGVGKSFPQRREGGPEAEAASQSHRRESVSGRGDRES